MSQKYAHLFLTYLVKIICLLLIRSVFANKCRIAGCECRIKHCKCPITDFQCWINDCKRLITVMPYHPVIAWHPDNHVCAGRAEFRAGYHFLSSAWRLCFTDAGISTNFILMTKSGSEFYYWIRVRIMFVPKNCR